MRHQYSCCRACQHKTFGSNNFHPAFYQCDDTQQHASRKLYLDLFLEYYLLVDYYTYSGVVFYEDYTATVKYSYETK